MRDLPGGGAEVIGRDAAGARVALRGRHVFDSRPPGCCRRPHHPPPALLGLVRQDRTARVRPGRGGADGLPHPAARPGAVVRLRPAHGRAHGAGRVHGVLPRAHRRRLPPGPGPLHAGRPAAGRVRGDGHRARRHPDDRRPLPAPDRAVLLPHRHRRRRDPPLDRLHVRRGAAAEPCDRRGPAGRTPSPGAARPQRPVARDGRGDAAGAGHRPDRRVGLLRPSLPGCARRAAADLPGRRLPVVRGPARRSPDPGRSHAADRRRTPFTSRHPSRPLPPPPSGPEERST